MNEATTDVPSVAFDPPEILMSPTCAAGVNDPSVFFVRVESCAAQSARAVPSPPLRTHTGPVEYEVCHDPSGNANVEESSVR